MHVQQTIPTEPTATEQTLLRNLKSGSSISLVLLVRNAEARQRRGGSQYARLELGDRSTTVTAMAWDNAEQTLELCAIGSIVHIVGRYEEHERFGPQITIQNVSKPEAGSFDQTLLYEGPDQSFPELEKAFRFLAESITNTHLKRLLATIFDEEQEIWSRYKETPAAKHVHQAYRHGLLEHTLSVAQGVDAVSRIFPGVDRDLAVSGALLHDIGKIDTYQQIGNWATIDFSDNGRLLGEIPTGYWLVRCEIQKIEGFPKELELALLHIILSHHGALEYGSPVVPCTREATVVHFMDNLGGRLGSFDRLERELNDEQSWSRYDRSLGTSAFFYRDEK